VQKELETDIQGEISTNIQNGEKLIGVRVRLPNSYRQDPDLLKNIRIHSPNGSFLLGGLATVRTDPGQSEIDRENLKQMVAVTARLDNRDLGSAIAEIQKRLQKQLVLPQGITLQYGGTYETEQEAFRSLLLILAAASLLVFIILLIEFESFTISAAIYLITLLSLFGGLLALYITNVTFNISSFVGLILIVGASAENSIFLVHYYLHHRRSGLALHDSILDAAVIRIRPIIMTALAAIFTLFPLALGLGAGSQMQQPLAIAVIGGFTMSTVLLLFVLPVLLTVGGRKQHGSIS